MADEVFTGLVRSDESRQWMLDNAVRLLGAAQNLEFPKELDPRGIIRVENQLSFSSCVGHGLSSSGEACAWIDSGGTLKPQFSRWGAYIWAQTESGLLGRDQGAMISGAVKAGTRYGFCPEELWPYPSRYTTAVPSGAVAAAAPYQLVSHSVVNGYDDGFAWMNQGKGPLLIGVNWTSGLANNTGDVTLADAKGRTLGGHCMFLWGWLPDGRLWLGNSHGKGWGQEGWRPVRPEVVTYWAQTQEVYGLSDLKDVTQARPIIVDAGEGM